MSIKLWWAQLAINFAWSPVFFVAHQTALALVVVLLLLVAILAFIAASGGRIALRRGCSYHMRRG
jgi:tryptophan-rich sensory protein